MINFLQEGAGHQVLTAFVEIVFDNTDNRIPVSFFFLLSSLVQTLFIYYMCGIVLLIHIVCDKKKLPFLLAFYLYLSAAVSYIYEKNLVCS